MLMMGLFSLLFCIVYCSENRLKINITQTLTLQANVKLPILCKVAINIKCFSQIKMDMYIVEMK